MNQNSPEKIDREEEMQEGKLEHVELDYGEKMDLRELDLQAITSAREKQYPHFVPNH
jgi:hypothetical protein